MRPSPHYCSHLLLFETETNVRLWSSLGAADVLDAAILLSQFRLSVRLSVTRVIHS